MRFLLDAHLPRRLAAGLRAAGYQCDLTRQLLAADASGVEIARLANALGSAVLSKDIDFVDLARRGVLHVPLVRIRLQNMTAQETCDAVLPLMPSIVAAIQEGQRIVEIR